VRPAFFKFLGLQNIFQNFRGGGGKKNKNKIEKIPRRVKKK
jgi:hypothetical protein